MPFLPGQSYNVKLSAGAIVESAKGTMGIQLTFEHEDGSTITDTRWVTDGTRERVRKDLMTLGAKESDLGSPSFLENIGFTLQGAECNVSVIEEEYNGKMRNRIEWINPKRKPVSGNASARVASMLSGKKGKEGATDEDLPF